MARAPSKILHCLTKATRSPIRPILFNDNLFRVKPIPCQRRHYSVSTFYRQGKDATKETEDDVSGQMEYSSAEDTGTTMSEEESESPPNVTSEAPPEQGEQPKSGSLEKNLGDWIVHALKTKEAVSVGHPLTELAEGIYVRYLSWRQGGIAVNVMFERYERANSLNSELLTRLTTVFNIIARHKGIQGVCLSSKGQHFCGGADTSEMCDLKNPQEAGQFIQRISDLCDSIRNVPVPVVALIQGQCIGAGLEVAASCDIRVATKRAVFSMPEVRIHIPSVVHARLLCDIVGWGRARHLMLTGCKWSAETALQAGLITELLDDRKELWNWASHYMNQLNHRLVKNECRTQKSLMRKWEHYSLEDGIKAGAETFAQHFSQPKLGGAMRTTIMAEKHARAMQNVKHPHVVVKLNDEEDSKDASELPREADSEASKST